MPVLMPRSHLAHDSSTVCNVAKGPKATTSYITLLLLIHCLVFVHSPGMNGRSLSHYQAGFCLGACIVSHGSPFPLLHNTCIMQNGGRKGVWATLN